VDLHDEKKRLINHLTPLLDSSSNYYETTVPEKIPSLLPVKTAMKLNDNSFDHSISTEQMNLDVNDYKNVGEQLGTIIWNSRQKLRENVPILENPASIMPFQKY